ncbi:uncharacterized protein LOC144732811 [Lampetra planeri]
MVLPPCGQRGGRGQPGGHVGQQQQHQGRGREALGGRYTLLGPLGSGTYGKVHKGVERLTGRQVAIKTIRKDKVPGEDGIARIRREIRLMATLRHPHIIGVHEVLESRERLVLVLELASRGELYDLVSHERRLPEDEARRLFRQIVSAVLYCHQNGIVHRDLKLENILLDESYNVKIADFGLSSEFGNGRLLSTFCGSPLYASPEIVNGTAYLGPEVDSWALGVLLYILVYGSMPFHGRHLKALTRHISRGEYAEPAQPSDACGLIRWLLMVNPARRACVRDAAAHWWVNLGYDTPLGTSCDEPVSTAAAATAPPTSLTRWLSDGDLGETGNPEDLGDPNTAADPKPLVGDGGSSLPASPMPDRQWSEDDDTPAATTAAAAAAAAAAPRPPMQWISDGDHGETPKRGPGDPNTAPGHQPFIREDGTSTLALSAQEQWLHIATANATTTTVIIAQGHYGSSPVGYEARQPPKGILKNHGGLLPDPESSEDAAWIPTAPVGVAMDSGARWRGVSARALDGAGAVPHWRTRGSCRAAPRRACCPEGSCPASSSPTIPELPPPPRSILKVNGRCSTIRDPQREHGREFVVEDDETTAGPGVVTDTDRGGTGHSVQPRGLRPLPGPHLSDLAAGHLAEGRGAAT